MPSKVWSKDIERTTYGLQTSTDHPTDRPTDRRTDLTGAKQYAPSFVKGGHKNKYNVDILQIHVFILNIWSGKIMTGPVNLLTISSDRMVKVKFWGPWRTSGHGSDAKSSPQSSCEGIIHLPSAWWQTLSSYSICPLLHLHSASAGEKKSPIVHKLNNILKFTFTTCILLYLCASKQWKHKYRFTNRCQGEANGIIYRE